MKLGKNKKPTKEELLAQLEEMENTGNGHAKNTETYDIPNVGKWQSFMGKKLLVSFWLIKTINRKVVNKKFVGSKICKIGDDIVNWQDKTYNIDYDGIFEGKKYFELELDVRNAIGTIACYDISPKVDNKMDGKLPPDVIANFITKIKADIFLSDSGRSWRKIALIALIASVIAGIGLMIMVTQYIGINTAYGKEKTFHCQQDPTYTGCPPPPKPPADKGATK